MIQNKIGIFNLNLERMFKQMSVLGKIMVSSIDIFIRQNKNTMMNYCSFCENISSIKNEAKRKNRIPKIESREYSTSISICLACFNDIMY